MSTHVRAIFVLALWAPIACSNDRGGPSMTMDGGMENDGGQTTPDGGTTQPDGSVSTSIWVDPMCTDGQYSETLANNSAEISDLISSYAPANVDAFLKSTLERRYPVGKFLVEKGQANPQFPQDCLQAFLGGQSATAEQAFGRLGTIVHECGHIYDFDRSVHGNVGAHYAITETLSFQCSNGNSAQLGGQTFARSLLNGDEYAPLRAPCNGSQTPGCDSYADVYLDGIPDDQEFDGGDQGFSVLLEETVQYVNSLAVAYAFVDQQDPRFRTSGRDGILTFLWYVERYLKLARETNPAAYAAIANDACWRDAILSVWGRAWLYLDATEDLESLTIDGPAIEALVLDPDLLGEIERLRSASGC